MSSVFTRREVLAAFLGLPAALAACRSAKTSSPLEGEIVGASDLIGHRLRDGLRVTPSADAWQRVGVVIVGAGVAGLAAAWRFLQSGFDDFVLIELEPAPGGTARSGNSSLGSYPWGAHYLPAPMKDNALLVSLLKEMGVVEGSDGDGNPVVAEQFICRDPEERVFYGDRWYEGLYLSAGASALDKKQLDSFNAEVNRWAGWRDAEGRRAFSIPVAFSSRDSEVTSLDKISMSDWMTARGYTSSRLQWLVDYACRDDYGLRMSQTSAWAGLFYFTSRLARPEAATQPLITWPEGNGRLIAHLYGKCSSRVRLGMAVAEITPAEEHGRTSVNVTAVNHRAEEAVGYNADRVIFAAPNFLSRYLITAYRDSPPSHAGEFQYGAWMVANLFLKDRPQNRGFPLAWDNVIYDSPSLGYVVATHQRGIDRGPTVWTYYYPLCDGDPRAARNRLLGMSWKDCADVALSDLSRAHPDIRALVERLDVMRWGHAMIRPRPGFIWGPARIAAAKPYRGIHFANTDLSGVALFEEAFDHGVRAADEILSERFAFERRS